MENKKPSDFGLKYEAYDKEESFNLFNESFYISDSNGLDGNVIIEGVLQKDDDRSFAQHIENKHPLIYLLIHPDTYFDTHIYEM